MILSLTDLIYADEKDNGRDLHFDSAGYKYSFSFGYFSFQYLRMISTPAETSQPILG